MNRPFRRLAGQVLVYGSGRVVIQLFSLITLPILSRIFLPADYGVIETITVFAAFISILAGLALASSAQRSYFDYSAEQPAERRAVLSTAFWTMVVWSTALTAVVASLSRPLSELFFDGSAEADLIALAMAATPIWLVTSYFLEVLRLRQQPGRYVLLSLFGATLSVCLILAFVAVLDWGLEGFYLAAIASGVPAAILGLALVPGSLGLRFDRRELRIMLAYSLPLIPVAGTAWVMQFIDRFFVLKFVSVSELGLYSIGNRLANVLLLGVTAFSIAWAPFILELHNRDAQHEREVRAKSLTYVALALGFGAVLLSVFANEVLHLLTPPDFYGAYVVVGILCAGIVALGLNGVTMTGISISRRTGYFARYAVYTAVLNVALNFALIPLFGIVGAAVSTSVTYGVLAVLYYWRAQRLDPVSFELRRLVIILTITGVLMAVGTPIALDPPWLSIAAKLPIVLAFPVLVWMLGCVDTRLSSVLRIPLARLPRIG